MFTVGDKGTAISGVCSDSDTPVNLDGSTVTLHFASGGQLQWTHPATITDTAAGAWSYEFTDGDLDVAGVWEVEAQVTSADGNVVQTFGPERFIVLAGLG